MFITIIGTVISFFLYWWNCLSFHKILIIIKKKIQCITFQKRNYKRKFQKQSNLL